MLKVRLKIILLAVISFMAMGVAAVTEAQAAVMEFVPASGTYSVNATFDVKIDVDTKGEDTTSADAVITFDNNLLSVDDVSYGSFYPTVLHSEQNDKLYISGMVDDPGKVVNGKGTMATITFKALTSGTATVSFDCTDGKTDDSNVSKNDLDSTDILVCGSLADASYTLGNGVAQPTNTPAISELPETGGGTPSATITAIPQTGAIDFLQLMPKIMMGVALVIIGIVPLLI